MQDFDAYHDMAVSQNEGTAIEAPKYCNPYFGYCPPSVTVG